MFGLRSEGHRQGVLAIGTILTGLLLGSGVYTQAPPSEKEDFLGQVRKLNEIAVQKIESDLRHTIRDAQQLSAKDPDKALEKLTQGLFQLSEDTALTPNRKAQLTRLINDRIKSLQAMAERKPSTPEDNHYSHLEKKVSALASSDEQQKIRQAIEEIRNLQRDGNLLEARKKAEELGHRYPDNVAVQLVRRTASWGEQVNNDRGQYIDGNRRFAAASRDLHRSSSPAVTEMEFPKDWETRTKNRNTTTPLTAKEKEIGKALNSPITVTFKNSRFEEAIKVLSEMNKQPIMVDDNAVNEAQINYDTPVSLEARELAFRTVLKKVLGQFGLTFVIKNETIQVTSTARAKEMMVVRSYPIADLLGNSGALTGILGFPIGGDNDPIVLKKQVDQIMDLIQNSVDPGSWQRDGGSGTITFHAPTMSLVIRQSAEVHMKMAGF